MPSRRGLQLADLLARYRFVLAREKAAAHSVRLSHYEPRPGARYTWAPPRSSRAGFSSTVESDGTCSRGQGHFVR